MEEEGETFIAHLGLGEEWGQPVTEPTPLRADFGNVRSVAAGTLHSLVLSHAGAVWSFGAGWEGPLGHGNEATIAFPMRISALDKVTIETIAAGRAHSLALSADGALYSWGWGRHGQLGHGERASLRSPRRVEAIAPPLFGMLVAAGDAHTVLLCRSGDVFTFGQALHGQCGHGTCGCHGEDIDDELLPKQVEALAHCSVARVSATANTTTAVTEDGSTFAWGDLPGCGGCVPLPSAIPTRGQPQLPRISSSTAISDGCAVSSQNMQRLSCLRTAA